MVNFLVFLGVLSILVLIHELGHFLAAKIFGIKVEEFAFGLPFTRPLFKVIFGETQYAFYPVLFGGFVRLHGEETEGVDKARSFSERTARQRMIVIAAGVVMNAVLALVMFVALYSIIGIPVTSKDQVTLVHILNDSPAKKAGLADGDRVVAVENKPLANADEFRALMKSWAGISVNLTIERGGVVPLFEGLVRRGQAEQFNATVVPRADPPAGQGALGVAIADYPYLDTEHCFPCVGRSIWAGTKAVGVWMGKTMEGLRSIGKSLLAGKKPEGVAGPIGIYQLTGMVAGEGVLPLMELVAVLSINLAVFNILPIPALDGGRLVFIYLELARKGKRLNAEMEAKINSWGMILLLSLIALISLQDVVRLGIWEKIKYAIFRL